LAQMHAKGTGVPRNCRVAMELYKNVAERGRWSERFMDAYVKFQNGAVDEAAFRYLFMAELGYEAAQTNFAYLMDQEESHLFPREEAYRRALLSWQRAANQDYAFARVKLGDYNYYGLGTSVDYAAAANHYKIAATSHQNAQAMFNLGFMHEQGLGVTKDLYLAKRFYDLAADTSTDAFVPVALALMKLKALFIVEYISNFSLKVPSFHALDALLGPNWDLYLISILLGIVVWLAYCYYFRRMNNHQR
jgi:SEL1 protein